MLFLGCMGLATLNHLMNTAHFAYKWAIGRTSLSSSFQLAGLPPTNTKIIIYMNSAECFLFRPGNTVDIWLWIEYLEKHIRQI